MGFLDLRFESLRNDIEPFNTVAIALESVFFFIAFELLALCVEVLSRITASGRREAFKSLFVSLICFVLARILNIASNALVAGANTGAWLGISITGGFLVNFTDIWILLSTFTVLLERRLSLGNSRLADPPNAAKQYFYGGLLAVMLLLATARTLAIGVSLGSLTTIDPAVLHGNIHGAPQILQHAYNGVFLIAVFDLLFTALDVRSRSKQLEGACDTPVYLVTVLAMPAWFLHVAYSIVQAFATSHQPLPFITDVENFLLPTCIFCVLLVAGFYCAPRGMPDAEAQRQGLLND